MTFDIALVLSIVALAVLLFVTELIRVDVVALLILGSLALTGLVTPTEALSGFSNPAVVTVWAVFILLYTALLHDVGWGEAVVRGQDHAQFAAARMRQILSPAPFDKVEALAMAILAHWFRAGPPPECPEERVLFDANEPDAFMLRLFDRRADEVAGRC
jgi:hypothetical protein